MSVRYRRNEQGVWRAVVDRPEVRNAVNFAVMEDLEELVEEVEADPEARVMTFRGAGDAFVSGGDLEVFAQLDDAEDVAAMSRRMKRCLARIEQLDCWTVACVNGAAFGGGVEMALAFDFRVAADAARFGFVQAKLAIPPGWGGLTRLVDLVGRSRALWWLGTAATVGAEEAARAGLVDEVAPPRQFADYADDVVARLAKTSPELTKTLKQGADRAQRQPYREAIRAELEPFVELWGSERHIERLGEFFSSD